MLSKKFEKVKEAIESRNLEEAKALLDEIRLLPLSDVAIELKAAFIKRISAIESHNDISALNHNHFVSKEKYLQSSKRKTFLIVTPTYNSEKYLDETIESVVTQQGDFDVFYHIQDGGSTDSTLEKINHWNKIITTQGNLFVNKRIHFSWSTSKDKGMYDAINKGIDYLKSQIEISVPLDVFISWINSDDLLAKNSLRTVSAFFSSSEHFNWLTGIASTIDDKGAITAVNDYPKAYSKSLLKNGLYDGRNHPAFVCQEGTFLRLAAWNEVGGINPDYKLAGDWDLWRKLANITPLIKLEATLALHRRHSSQLSHNIEQYYAEIDTLSERAVAKDIKLDKTGYRAVYDTNIQNWNAIQDDCASHDLKLIPMPPSKVLHEIALKVNGISTNSWPKISVITPTYNQGKYIRETIESVISQNYPNLEFIIIDGASTDETVSIVNEYEEYISYFVSEKDNGQSHAINKGFAQATGDIFTWLNSDDLFAPNALHSMAVAFKTSDADMVAGICEVYEEGKLIHRHMTSCSDGPLPIDPILELDTGWNAGQFFYQPEVFFTRELWEKAGGHVREDCFYSMDYEMWCRFAAVKAKLHVIGKTIVHFRSHSEQKTADPELFKKELTSVKANFLKEWGIKPSTLERPPLDWERKLNVAMVNDHGYKYGAGIAHQRIAGGFDLAGHRVRNFDLKTYLIEFSKNAEEALCKDVKDFTPDLVIFGNIHSATKSSVFLIDELEKYYPTYWLTHDFWLLTGRCAYVQNCTKYLTGCDAACPTSTEYPNLEPQMIKGAWSSKRDVLAKTKNLTFLANSGWAKDFSEKSISTFENKINVEQIKLGAPAEIFKPLDKGRAKEQLGVTPGNFTIAFSVSSFSDKRKGGDILVKALNEMELSNITVILIGHHDQELPVENIELISLGYIDSTDVLVTALNAADVFIGPSREETLGQVFLEAAMCGTPSIGFDATGVKDAIVDGVTGIKVKDISSAGLKGTLITLIDDPAYTAHLGKLASLYAGNEFSIEASYRSFYSVLDKQGLIDDWAMPHKISYKRKSSILSKTDKPWYALKGVSPEEGPYPEHNIEHNFNWLFGSEIVINMNAVQDSKRIKLSYLNPIFNQLSLDIYVNNQFLGSYTVEQTQGELAELSIALPNSIEGNFQLRIEPSDFLKPSGSEKRELVFKLIDLGLYN